MGKIETSVAITVLSVALGVSGFGQEGAEEKDLPPRAQAALRTLEHQEKDGLIRLNQIYITKLAALKKEYVQASKLDEAEAVQKEIETLEAELATLKAVKEPEKEKKRNVRKISGTKWEMAHPKSGGKASIEFLADGIAAFRHNGVPNTWSWEEIEPGIVETWGRSESKGRGWRFEFEGMSRKGVVISADRKSKSEATLVR